MMHLPTRRPKRSTLAILACLAFVIAGAQHVRASSADAWEEFQQDVETACRSAAEAVLEVGRVQVDPYGSESYGFALLSGIEKGGSTAPRLLVCVYDKASKSFEISGSFDP